jgi:hypothetical protein
MLSRGVGVGVSLARSGWKSRSTEKAEGEIDVVSKLLETDDSLENHY